MAWNIHTSHRAIFLLPAGIYLLLVFVIAILPAMAEKQREDQYIPLAQSEAAAWGRELYRKDFNCVVCHTQQIRGDERLRFEELDPRSPTGKSWRVPVLQADRRFGQDKPTRGEEYAHQEAPMLGTQRTGPDLMGVGKRLPDFQWHHWHLYSPRSVSPDSVMPAYRYLYSTEKPPAENGIEPQPVSTFHGLGVDGDVLWATPRAVALVEYLLSLKRDPIQKKSEVK